MSLEKVCCRVSEEEDEQLQAALLMEAPELIYIDAASFPAGDYGRLSDLVHEHGKRIGLRLPAIFRKRAGEYFDAHMAELSEAGFDSILVRSLEGLSYLREQERLHEFFEEVSEGKKELILDHNVYVFNALTMEALMEITGLSCFGLSLPLELSDKELKALSEKLFKAGCSHTELTVYGRAPMMVSAQCVHSLYAGCDRRPSSEGITDRTGRRLISKNYCDFCYNVIYNSVPTVLYDLGRELSGIRHQAERFEFTTESAEEVRDILSASYHFPENGFTRAWFRKGTM